MEKINKNTILSEILTDEKMAEILAKNNLPCLSCPFAKYEMEQLKIGEVCSQYGINTEKLLEELNGVLFSKKSKPKTRNKKTRSTSKK
jgi:hypothetical protein